MVVSVVAMSIISHLIWLYGWQACDAATSSWMRSNTDTFEAPWAVGWSRCWCHIRSMSSSDSSQGKTIVLAMFPGVFCNTLTSESMIPWIDKLRHCLRDSWGYWFDGHSGRLNFTNFPLILKVLLYQCLGVFKVISKGVCFMNDTGMKGSGYHGKLIFGYLGVAITHKQPALVWI